MGIVKKLKGKELVGWTLEPNTDVFPITATSAVFDLLGLSLDEILTNIQNSSGGTGGSSTTVLSGRLLLAFTIASSISEIGDSYRKLLKDVPTGFKSNPDATIPSGKYVFMVFAYKNSDGSYAKDSNGNIWSVPILLGGGTTSSTGADNGDYNYIYCRMATLVTPSLANVTIAKVEAAANGYGIIPDSGNTGSLSANAVNIWTDHPRGVTAETPFEYMAIYKYNSTNTNADKWELLATVIWSHYGIDGRDGDGTEYIYFEQKINAEVPTLNSPYIREGNLYTISSPVYLEDDFVPDNWLDNPMSLESDTKAIYVSTRKKVFINNTSTKGTWGEFTEPKVWTKSSDITTIIYKGVKEFYKVTNTSNTPSFNKDNIENLAELEWSENVPSNYSESNPYLWNAEVLISEDADTGAILYGKVTITLIGHWGENSLSIGSIVNLYVAKDSIDSPGPNDKWESFNNANIAWSIDTKYLWGKELFYSEKDITIDNYKNSNKVPFFISAPHIIGIKETVQSIVGDDTIKIDLSQLNANVYLGANQDSIIKSTRCKIRVTKGSTLLKTTNELDYLNKIPYFDIEYDLLLSTIAKSYTSFSKPKTESGNDLNVIEGLEDDEFYTYKIDRNIPLYVLGIKVTIHYWNESLELWDSQSYIYKLTINIKECAYDLDINPAGFVVAAIDTKLPEDIYIKVIKRYNGGEGTISESTFEEDGLNVYMSKDGNIFTQCNTWSGDALIISKDNFSIEGVHKLSFTLKRNGNYEDSEDILIARDGETGDEGPGCEYIFFKSSSKIDNFDGSAYDPNYQYNTEGTDGDKKFLDDDYVPTGRSWTDDITEVTATAPYLYVSIRRKKEGVWNKFEKPSLYKEYISSGYSMSIDNDNVILDDDTTGAALSNAVLCGVLIFKGDIDITNGSTEYRYEIKFNSLNNLKEYTSICYLLDANENGIIDSNESPTNLVWDSSNQVIDLTKFNWTLKNKDDKKIPEGNYGIKITVDIFKGNTKLASLDKIQSIIVKDFNDGKSYKLLVTPNTIRCSRTSENAAYTIADGTQLLISAKEFEGDRVRDLYITDNIIDSYSYIKVIECSNNTPKNEIAYEGNELEGDGNILEAKDDTNKVAVFNPVKPYLTVLDGNVLLTHYIVELYIKKEEEDILVDSETINFTVTGDKGEPGSSTDVVTPNINGSGTLVVNPTEKTFKFNYKINCNNVSSYTGTVRFVGLDNGNDIKTTIVNSPTEIKLELDSTYIINNSLSIAPADSYSGIAFDLNTYYLFTWAKCTLAIVTIKYDDDKSFTDSVIRTGLDGYIFDADENGFVSFLSVNGAISTLSLTASDILLAVTTTLAALNPNYKNKLLNSNFVLKDAYWSYNLALFENNQCILNSNDSYIYLSISLEDYDIAYSIVFTFKILSLKVDAELSCGIEYDEGVDFGLQLDKFNSIKIYNAVNNILVKEYSASNYSASFYTSNLWDSSVMSLNTLYRVEILFYSPSDSGTDLNANLAIRSDNIAIESVLFSKGWYTSSIKNIYSVIDQTAEEIKATVSGNTGLNIDGGTTYLSNKTAGFVATKENSTPALTILGNNYKAGAGYIANGNILWDDLGNLILLGNYKLFSSSTDVLKLLSYVWRIERLEYQELDVEYSYYRSISKVAILPNKASYYGNTYEIKFINIDGSAVERAYRDGVYKEYAYLDLGLKVFDVTDADTNRLYYSDGLEGHSKIPLISTKGVDSLLYNGKLYILNAELYYDILNYINTSMRDGFNNIPSEVDTFYHLFNSSSNPDFVILPTTNLANLFQQETNDLSPIVTVEAKVFKTTIWLTGELDYSSATSLEVTNVLFWEIDSILFKPTYISHDRDVPYTLEDFTKSYDLGWNLRLDYYAAFIKYVKETGTSGALYKKYKNRLWID